MKLWLFGSSNACKKQDRQNNTEEFHWYNRTIEQKKMNLIETQINMGTQMNLTKNRDSSRYEKFKKSRFFLKLNNLLL